MHVPLDAHHPHPEDPAHDPHDPKLLHDEVLEQLEVVQLQLLHVRPVGPLDVPGRHSAVDPHQPHPPSPAQELHDEALHGPDDPASSVVDDVGPNVALQAESAKATTSAKVCRHRLQDIASSLLLALT